MRDHRNPAGPETTTTMTIELTRDEAADIRQAIANRIAFLNDQLDAYSLTYAPIQWRERSPWLRTTRRLSSQRSRLVLLQSKLQAKLY